jgi:hypothetical protein
LARGNGVGQGVIATAGTELLAFTAFGVPVEVSVPGRLHADALALVPPGAELEPAGEPLTRVAIAEHTTTLSVSVDDQVVGVAEDAELALGMLDAQIRAQVALRAPEHIFTHAGVVAARGRAIVLPGLTFSGKTTLTRALVTAGATYLSDEFAVFDRDGRVHPYAKPLSIRAADGSGRSTETPASALGGLTAEAAVPLGMVAVTSYRPGAILTPEPLGSGAALLALLSNTIPARTRPEQSLAALKAAVQRCVAWRGDRGEADAAAREILAMAAW